MEKVSNVMAKRSEMLAKICQGNDAVESHVEKEHLSKRILKQMRSFFCVDGDKSRRSPESS